MDGLDKFMLFMGLAAIVFGLQAIYGTLQAIKGELRAFHVKREHPDVEAIQRAYRNAE